MATPQQYPRIADNEKLAGYLDESRLTPHAHKLAIEKLKEIIAAAVRDANKKSSRAILKIAETSSEDEVRETYLREGKKLFAYFRDYCGDPAFTAFQCQGQHYSKVATEQFRNRTLQKERMNSGWRYQLIALECAKITNQNVLAREIAGLDPEVGEVDSVFYLEKTTGLKYEEVMQVVCGVLTESSKKIGKEIVPEVVVQAFGDECKRHRLLDGQEKFCNAKELVHFFCSA
jgi:hypothetical protein